MELKEKIGIGRKWNMKLATTFAILKNNGPCTSNEIYKLQPLSCNYSLGTIKGALSQLYRDGWIKSDGWKHHARIYKSTPKLIEYAKRQGIIEEETEKNDSKRDFREEWEGDVAEFEKLKKQSIIIGYQRFQQNFETMIEYEFSNGQFVTLPEKLTKK